MRTRGTFFAIYIFTRVKFSMILKIRIKIQNCRIVYTDIALISVVHLRLTKFKFALIYHSITERTKTVLSLPELICH